MPPPSDDRRPRAGGVRDATCTGPVPPAERPRTRRGLHLPALLLLLAMSVFPLLWALYLSFTDYSATRGGPAHFVWFGNSRPS
ncbi:hypothetical protein NKG94_16190 [Micromonospora sp. M12]